MRRWARQSGAERLVPKATPSHEALELARRRYGTLWLISMPMTALHLPVSLFDGKTGAVSLLAEFGLLGLEGTLWRICRTPRLDARRALVATLWVGILHAWLVSVVVHFAPGAHVAQFSMVLLQVIIAALVVPLPSKLLLSILLVDALSQPLTAMLAVRLGYASATQRELTVSWLGAAFVFALSAVAARLIVQLRVDLTREMGGYSLVRLIARGGMGEVWEGRHRFLARPAAVKLLTAEGASSSEVASQTITRNEQVSTTARRHRGRFERFEREAQATALLQSPHTVSLYDFGVSETGRLYYAMELLDGFDFQELVERFGALPPARVVYLMRQVCDSLGEAHAAGLVHRDLKPSNLFLVKRGIVRDFAKVLDFGLLSTQDTSEGALSALSHDRAIPGTPAYYAPEQALGSTIDARSDIYQLGCVMFFLLTGRTVFEGRSALGLVWAHANEPPKPLREVTPSVPAELDEVVMRCLAKNPKDRPQSAEDLERALRSVTLEQPWSADQASSWWTEHAKDRALGRPTMEAALRRRVGEPGSDPRSESRWTRPADDRELRSGP